MNENDFDRYQEWTRGIAVYKGRGTWLGFNYCCLKLAGEAGEVTEGLGKLLRDSDGDIQDEDFRQATLKELGDVLWYVSQCADELGFNLSDVVEANKKKLEDRRDRGVLHGSGDDR